MSYLFCWITLPSMSRGQKDRHRHALTESTPLPAPARMFNITLIQFFANDSTTSRCGRGAPRGHHLDHACRVLRAHPKARNSWTGSARLSSSGKGAPGGHRVQPGWSSGRRVRRCHVPRPSTAANASGTRRRAHRTCSQRQIVENQRVGAVRFRAGNASPLARGHRPSKAGLDFVMKLRTARAASTVLAVRARASISADNCSDNVEDPDFRNRVRISA